MFLDPNQQAVETSNQMMPQDQSYFNRPTSQYEIMGMQPVPGQGMIQYVPVVVTPPLASPISSTNATSNTHARIIRTSTNWRSTASNDTRMSQYALQYPPPAIPQQPMMSQQAMMSQQSLVTSSPPSNPHLSSTIRLSRPSSLILRSKINLFFIFPTTYCPSKTSLFKSSIQTQFDAPIPLHLVDIVQARMLVLVSVYLQSTDHRCIPNSHRIDDDDGWESLRRKKEEMQARRMSRMQTAA